LTGVIREMGVGPIWMAFKAARLGNPMPVDHQRLPTDEGYAAKVPTN
jgi:hypothetical protein